jgi:hypothetical protein
MGNSKVDVVLQKFPRSYLLICWNFSRRHLLRSDSTKTWGTQHCDGGLTPCVTAKFTIDILILKLVSDFQVLSIPRVSWVEATGEMCVLGIIVLMCFYFWTRWRSHIGCKSRLLEILEVRWQAQQMNMYWANSCSCSEETTSEHRKHNSEVLFCHLLD